MRQGQGPVVCLALLSVSLAGCKSRTDTEPSDPNQLRLVVGIPPQAYFARRIAGERATVEVLVSPGQNPHTYQPTARQAVRLSQARVYFSAGLPFEEILLAKLAARQTGPRVVHLSHHHHHDPHAHGELDPHTWLAPRLAAEQAERMCEAISEIDPAGADEYRRNLALLQTDLERLDARLAEILAPVAGRTFYVFHPAFGHFAEAYGLTQVAVEAGGKDPSARHVNELIDAARGQGARVIFVEPQFSRRSAEVVARRVGAELVELDPLAPDYMANMEEIATKIRAALVAPEE